MHGSLYECTSIKTKEFKTRQIDMNGYVNIYSYINSEWYCCIASIFFAQYMVIFCYIVYKIIVSITLFCCINNTPQVLVNVINAYLTCIL